MPYADPSSEAARSSRRRCRLRYEKAHPEKTKAHRAKWFRENREKNNANSVERRSKKLAVAQVLFNNAKARARAQGIAFDIVIADIVVPEFCPCLGLRLEVATGYAKANSPSLDRIDPALGYVRGNICVISHKANTIKSNATLADLLAVASYILEGRK